MYGYEGLKRGGIRGCCYDSYATCVATVAWSNKLKAHVYLVESNIMCGWSKTTSKTLGQLWDALPSSRTAIKISSVYGSGIIDKHAGAFDSDGWKKPLGAASIRAICATLLDRRSRFWNDEEHKVTVKKWREHYLLILGTLKEMVKHFTSAETGISDKKAQELEQEINKYKIWSKDCAKLTAAEIKERLEKKKLAELKQAFTNGVAHRKLYFTHAQSTGTRILAMIRQHFGEKGVTDPGIVFRGVYYAFEQLDAESENVHRISRLLSVLQEYIAYLGYTWDSKNNCAKIRRAYKDCCNLSGVQLWTDKYDVDHDTTDLLYFDDSKETMHTTRHCLAPYREVNILLHAYTHNKPIHGKKVGVYTILDANSELVTVGCHKFSGAFLRFLHDLVQNGCPDTPEAYQYRELGAALIADVMNSANN
jgi:hypothetical protein